MESFAINSQALENMNLLLKDNIESNIDLSQFKGLLLLKYLYNDPTKIHILQGSENTTFEDKDKIRNWIITDNKYEISSGHYRIDLESYIIIFRLYNYIDGVVLLGHFLERNSLSRINLLEIGQQYLTEKLQ